MVWHNLMTEYGDTLLCQFLEWEVKLFIRGIRFEQSWQKEILSLFLSFFLPLPPPLSQTDTDTDTDDTTGKTYSKVLITVRIQQQGDYDLVSK